MNDILNRNRTAALFLLVVCLVAHARPALAEIQLQHGLVSGNQTHLEWGSNNSMITQGGRNNFNGTKE